MLFPTFLEKIKSAKWRDRVVMYVWRNLRRNIIIVGPLSMRIGINSLLPCMGANNIIVALM